MLRILEGNLGHYSVGGENRRQSSVGVDTIDLSVVNKSSEQSLQKGEVAQLRENFTTLRKMEVQRNRSTIIGRL